MSILEGFNSTLPVEGQLPNGTVEEKTEKTVETLENDVSGDVSGDVSEAGELEKQPEESIEPEELPEDPKSRNAAFAKMRVERREAEQRAADLERRIAEMEGVAKGRQELQEEITAAAPVEPEVEPDRYDEPEKHDEYLIKKAQEGFRAEFGDKFSKMEELEKQTKAAQYIQEQDQARRGLDNIKNEYLKVDPSFTEAHAYLIKSVENELKLNYPSATDIQIKQEVNRLELETAESQFRNGQNPAQMQVKLAQARGFKPSSKVTKPISNGRTNSFIGKTGTTMRGENPTIAEGTQMDLKTLFRNKDRLEKTLRESGV